MNPWHHRLLESQSGQCHSREGPGASLRPLPGRFAFTAPGKAVAVPELGESSRGYWPVAGAGSQTLHPLRILPAQQISTGSRPPVQPPRASTHPLCCATPAPFTRAVARALGGTGSPAAAGTLLRGTSKRAPLCACVFVPLPSVRLP